MKDKGQTSIPEVNWRYLASIHSNPMPFRKRPVGGCLNSMILPERTQNYSFLQLGPRLKVV